MQTTTAHDVTVDGQPIAALHASPMADVLDHYRRSIALILDRSEVLQVARLLEDAPGSDADKAEARNLADKLRQAVDDAGN